MTPRKDGDVGEMVKRSSPHFIIMEIRENERRFKMEVQFKDLSGWLKTAVVWGFISLGYSVVAFSIGFAIGMTY